MSGNKQNPVGFAILKVQADYFYYGSFHFLFFFIFYFIREKKGTCQRVLDEIILYLC